ncbi:MAG: SDR family NAD(P)-dependent oxidoreductase [Rhodobacteraceae bacterium]|nr:SDR family NAD(P)-dependent oxidoreductase [Paracoccaceae bacterium]
MTVAADQTRILSEIQAQHGRLDLLINNAGVFLAYDVWTDPDTLQKVEREIVINATAPLPLTRRALPLLAQDAQPGFCSSDRASPSSCRPERQSIPGTRR